jgi:CHAT domain-containing protein
VLASLWPVADASTAELMRTFYRARQTGLPTAEALQQAQRALLADPATAAPFYWAGFQLVGDWR